MTSENPKSLEIFCVAKFTDCKLLAYLTTGVTANCLHPGVVDTEIFRHVPIPLSWGLKLIRVFFKTPQQGCRTTVYLATSQDVQGVSGKYFRDCREAGLNRAVQDENTVKKVWELSRELSGLKEDDPRI